MNPSSAPQLRQRRPKSLPPIAPWDQIAAGAVHADLRAEVAGVCATFGKGDERVTLPGTIHADRGRPSHVRESTSAVSSCSTPRTSGTPMIASCCVRGVACGPSSRILSLWPIGGEDQGGGHAGGPAA
jgi:hypothetical protein